jgi:protein farnesyltransferase/geranylgeranyltransferase type-1 subunit alpha
VNEAGGLPIRSVNQVRPTGAGGTSATQTSSGGSSTGRPDFTWGRDRFGADLGDSTPEQLDRRRERALQLSALEIQHSVFLEKKEREKEGWPDSKTNEAVTVTADEVEEEKLRRKEIARLRMELYGERTGEYGTDPAWDDIVPMPIEEPEGALAAIAYPEEYAEGLINPPVRCTGQNADNS